MLYLYLDESGDLGFDFEHTTPSTFLTIAVLAIEGGETVKQIRQAVRRTLRRKVNRKKKENELELKGSNSTIEVKRHFYSQTQNLDFGIYALTLDKIRLIREFRSARPSVKERLYNYIANQVMNQIPLERATDRVELIVDKSKGKRQIADFNRYIVDQIQGRLDPRLRLDIYHRLSHTDHVLSAVDLFCWGIARSHQGDQEWINEYRDKILFDGRRS